MKDVNFLHVAKKILAMFFSVNGEVDSKDDKFLDSVRTYLKEIEKYKIVLNYYFPIFAPWMKELHLSTDMIDNESTHNYIRLFVKHELGNGQKIRYSEIQYEGIGLTLIDLENSNYDITTGYDLKNFLTAQEKSKKNTTKQCTCFYSQRHFINGKSFSISTRERSRFIIKGAANIKLY